MCMPVIQGKYTYTTTAYKAVFLVNGATPYGIYSLEEFMKGKKGKKLTDAQLDLATAAGLSPDKFLEGYYSGLLTHEGAVAYFELHASERAAHLLRTRLRLEGKNVDTLTGAILKVTIPKSKRPILLAFGALSEYDPDEQGIRFKQATDFEIVTLIKWTNASLGTWEVIPVGTSEVIPVRR